MVTKLSLSDFQSHHWTELDFSPGVNVIVGSSDSGKSAIIRALRWVVEGRPSGEDYKRHGGNQASVALCTTTHAIRRERVKQANVYRMGSEEFAAFGTSVPEPIVDALGFSDINLQAQMDAPFLLSATSGEVARYLNGIMGLDAIDSAVSRITSTARDLAKEEKRLAGETERLAEEVKAFDWLDAALADLEKVKAMAARHEENRQEHKTLKETVAALDTLVLPVLPGCGNLFEKIEADQTIIKAGHVEHAELSMICGQFTHEVQKAQELSLQITALEKEIREAAPRVCPTCGQKIPEGVLI